MTTHTHTATRAEPAALTVTLVDRPVEQPTSTGLAGSPVPAERIVDEALIESFPASDPPSWWAGVDRSHVVSKH